MHIYNERLFHVTNINVVNVQDLSETEIHPLCLGTGVNLFESSFLAQEWQKIRVLKSPIKIRVKTSYGSIFELSAQNNKNKVEKMMQYIDNRGINFKDRRSYLNTIMDCVAASENVQVISCEVGNLSYTDLDKNIIMILPCKNTKQFCVKNKSLLYIE